MAPLLKMRLSPLRVDLARLEEDPDAIWDYYREIERRIDLLPPLAETLRQTSHTECALRLGE